MIYTDVVRELKDNGAKCLMFGGAVRDKLLDRIPADYDFVVSDIDESLFDTLLAKHGEVFKGTIIPELRKVHIVDDYIDFKYCCNNDITAYLKANTDFTCNTITYDPLTEEMGDLFGGKPDIEQRLLRLITLKTGVEVYPGFIVAPLRAARFSAHYGFTIEPETYEFLKEHAFDIFEGSTQRHRSRELAKLFASDNARVAVDILMKFGIFERLFNEYEV